MSNTATANRRGIDAAIAGSAILGIILAIIEGLGMLDSGNIVFVLTIGFPAAIATLAYLHYYPNEELAVAGVLGIWGAIASAVALFGTFFIVMDNPDLVSDASSSSLLFVSSVTNFAFSVIALSGLYAIAGHYKSRAIAVVAPITQFIAFVIASYLTPMIA